MSDVLADRIERMERFVKRMNEVERDLSSPYVRPKDAATLILVDRAGRVPKVLLGKRHHGHKFMPGKFVFPGGRVDPADRRMPAARPLDPSTEAHLMKRLQRPSVEKARAFALAAIRETFEETGLLLGVRGYATAKVPRGPRRTSSPISARCTSSAAPSPRRAGRAGSTRASSPWMRARSRTASRA
jgi:8-oxo-dGTP pyrophosphatase MutT (NUDIX family)